MANSIGYASAYLDMLDKIYKAEAATSILEAAESKYRFSAQNAQTIYLKKLSVQGMGDYSRSTGYVSGNTTLTWESHSFGQDRGRKYNLDAMDSNEAKLQVAEIMAEVMRTQIVPEIDAYRFEKMCTLASLDVSADLTYDTAITAIDTGVETLDDAEVPKEGRVLFVSNSMYTKMKQSGEFFNVRMGQANNGQLNREIVTFDGMPIIRVPEARFYNDFDFYDGAGDEAAGGFATASGAKALNFMIVPISVIIAVVKHMQPKLIAPELNSDADGWIFAYRLYHDLFVPDNKVDGLYIHSVA